MKGSCNWFCCLCVLTPALLFGSAIAATLEDTVLVPAVVKDMYGVQHQHSVVVTVFRDGARAKSPFLVLNHGRSFRPGGNAGMGRVRYPAISRYFVEQGFAVFVLTRIGYGATGGPDVEYSGECGRRNCQPVYEAAAEQSLAVIAYAKTQSYVDGTRGIVVGQSFGGTTAATLAAKNVDGVLGTINFAGGGGGNPEAHPARPCSERQLADLFAGYGKTARTPMLWLYSENDRYWGPELPRQWFARYMASGAKAEFVPLPPYGKDGHGIFAGNPNAWMPAVEVFLKSQGL